jgi:ankyrin repeat protein
MRARSIVLSALIMGIALGVATAGDEAKRKAELEMIEAARWGKAADVAEAIEAGVDPDAKDADGISAIRWAAVEGNATVVEVLIDAGADVDSADPTGVTPLMMACRWAHMSTVRALVEAGADLDVLSDYGPGRTALMYAAIGGYNGAVTYLLESGANSKIKDRDGRNAAKLAEMWGREITAELIKDFR